MRESLAQLDETESALSILHALIHQSIARYSDTLQNSELPRFVDKCTQAFAQIAMSVQEPDAIFEHCRMLLQLSFETEQVFTPLLDRSSRTTLFNARGSGLTRSH